MSEQVKNNFKRFGGTNIKDIDCKVRKNSDNTMIKKQSKKTKKQADPILSPEETILEKNDDFLESAEQKIRIRYAEKEGNKTAQEKNKWMERITSLTAQKIRDTVFSQQEGPDVLSEHLLVENSQILSKIGTLAKDSI